MAGVNADLRDACDELAKQGYFALSPDLFWRMEPGVDLSDQTEAEWKKGFVVFYGGNTEKHLDEARNIKNPLMMHLGEEDEYISKEAQREIIVALPDNKFAEVFTYHGCNHAFARHRGIHFDKDAARLANRKLEEIDLLKSPRRRASCISSLSPPIRAKPPPTLVVNGKHDLLVPTINSYILQQYLPNATLIIYPDSGRGAIFQFSDLFVREAQFFLNSQ